MNKERAFPSEQGHIPDGTWNQTYESGMMLRDYMATNIFTGLLVRERIAPRYHDAGNDDDTMGDVYARAAYGYADAMMRARKSNGI